jgi:hypothetical protein
MARSEESKPAVNENLEPGEPWKRPALRLPASGAGMGDTR